MTADQELERVVACDACDHGDWSDSECYQCGGEGVVYGCGWDWQCDTYDEGEGTCLCERRCDVCQPMPDAEKVEREALRKVLADALARHEHRETNDG